MKKLKDFEGRSRIQTRLNRIRKDGYFGQFKSVREGVFELIVDVGPGYRVYFADDTQNDEIILLCGGEKHRQDLDIDRAKKYWRDYKQCLNEAETT